MQSETDFFKNIFKTPEARLLQELLTLCEKVNEREPKQIAEELCGVALRLFNQIGVTERLPQCEKLHSTVMSFHLRFSSLSPEEFITEVKKLTINYLNALPNNGEVIVTAMRY